VARSSELDAAVHAPMDTVMAAAAALKAALLPMPRDSPMPTRLGTVWGRAAQPGRSGSLGP